MNNATFKRTRPALRRIARLFLLVAFLVAGGGPARAESATDAKDAGSVVCGAPPLGFSPDKPFDGDTEELRTLFAKFAKIIRLCLEGLEDAGNEDDDGLAVPAKTRVNLRVLQIALDDLSVTADKDRHAKLLDGLAALVMKLKRLKEAQAGARAERDASTAVQKFSSATRDLTDMLPGGEKEQPGLADLFAERKSLIADIGALVQALEAAEKAAAAARAEVLGRKPLRACPLSVSLNHPGSVSIADFILKDSPQGDRFREIKLGPRLRSAVAKVEKAFAKMASQTSGPAKRPERRASPPSPPVSKRDVPRPPRPILRKSAPTQTPEQDPPASPKTPDDSEASVEEVPSEQKEEGTRVQIPQVPKVVPENTEGQTRTGAPGTSGGSAAIEPKVLVPENPAGQTTTGAPAAPDAPVQNVEQDLLPGGIIMSADELLETFFDPQYQSVGAVLTHDYSGAPYEFSCSGVLIGRQTFATAAHCIREHLNADAHRVYLPYGGIFEVDRVYWRPFEFELLNGDEFDRKLRVTDDALSIKDTAGTKADIALLILKSVPHGLQPALLLSNDTEVQNYRIPAKIYGFGRTRGAVNDSGILRSGHVCTQPCRAEYPNEELLCWGYQPTSDLAKKNRLSNSCFGDSGGPVFYNVPETGNVALAALVSGGQSTDCGEGDLAFNTRISRHAEWIKQVFDREDPESKCEAKAGTDDCPEWEFIEEQTYPIYARFTESISLRTFPMWHPQLENHEIVVRIAFNGMSANGMEFEFAVLPGHTAQVRDFPVEHGCTDFKMKSMTQGQFGFCEITGIEGLPFNEREFSIVVKKKKKGNADFQILVSWWKRSK